MRRLGASASFGGGFLILLLDALSSTNASLSLRQRGSCLSAFSETSTNWTLRSSHIAFGNLQRNYQPSRVSPKNEANYSGVLRPGLLQLSASTRTKFGEGRSHMRVLPPGTLCPTTSAPCLILSSSENSLHHSILVKLLTFNDFRVSLCALASG